jgi:hypothetical protein
VDAGPASGAAPSSAAVTLAVVNVLAVIVAALGGGIIAAWIGSWFDRLAALETARLVVLAELMANLAIHHSFDMLEPDERPAHVIYSSSAWLTHRDRLAVRFQRYPDLWSALYTFYGIVTSLPRYSEPLEESVEQSITYAIANLDLLELSTLELVPVYGPRRAYTRWRERRRREVSAPEPTA